MRNLSCKRGQVGGIGMSIMAIVIAAVFLILGLVVLQSIRNTDVVRSQYTKDVANDTLITPNNLTYTQITTCAATPGGNSIAIRSVFNASTGALIAAPNYTLDSDCGIKVTRAGVAWTAVPWNISYTFKHGGESWTGTNQTLAGIANFSDFWEIIVLAIVISLVIGLLLIAFARKAMR